MMDMSPRQIATMLRGGNVGGLLKEPVYPGPDGDEPEYSQAQVIADVINVMRLDNRALGETVGVDIMVTRITEDRVAEMLGSAVEGDPTDLVETFNELEEQRDRILREMMDEDDYDEFVEFKRSSIETAGGEDES